MPINHDIGIAAFWLHYEYVRLDVVGTIGALQDFLDYAPEEDMRPPVAYQLDIPEQDARFLPLTTESQALWINLRSKPIAETLRHTDDPLESSWLDQDVRQHLITRSVAGQEFLLFSAVSQGVPYSAIAQMRVRPKNTHTYRDYVAKLDIKCSIERGNLARDVTELIGFSVDANAPAVAPTAGKCNGKPCFKYGNSADRATSWTTTVWPVDLSGTIYYSLSGSLQPYSRDLHAFTP